MAAEEAVTSDRSVREDIRAQVEDTRQATQLVLLIASFGILSLLLVAAYLASDLFRPLREIERALGDVEEGDLDRRLDEERADELGAVNRAFNRTMEAVSRREQLEGLAAAASGDDGGIGPGGAYPRESRCTGWFPSYARGSSSWATSPPTGVATATSWSTSSTGSRRR